VHVVGTVLGANRGGITIRTAGGETRKFPPLNDAVEEQLGRSGNKLTGKPVNILVVERTMGYRVAEIRINDDSLCVIHGKKSFKSEHTALLRLESIRANPKTRVIPIRAYQDQRCGHWHLTSQPSRENLWTRTGLPGFSCAGTGRSERQTVI
jgi:hypothetical protein